LIDDTRVITSIYKRNRIQFQLP